MKNSLLATLVLAGVSGSAFAGTTQPGSLLLFPLFDNARGDETFLTVTNTNATDSVTIEYVYIDGYDCLEFNRTRNLTPNDTLTVRTKSDNPNMVTGYCYVFAKNAAGAVSFNHLIGSALINDGSTGSDYEIQPYTFEAVGAKGTATDVDGNGVRDMDGVEYEAAPDALHIPRFIGQGAATTDLILINLTGGASFTAIVDFLVYNDNEEVFSAQKSVQCWDKYTLTQVSGLFSDSFLAGTNNAAGESLGGAETGWYSMKGRLSFSSADSEANPAILALQVERRGSSYGAVAALPYGTGARTNGGLIFHGPFIP